MLMYPNEEEKRNQKNGVEKEEEADTFKNMGMRKERAKSQIVSKNINKNS